MKSPGTLTALRSGDRNFTRHSAALLAPGYATDSLTTNPTTAVFSHFFIRRPIFAAVLSIIITLAGALAVFVLPIAQYPEITPPTVQVTASYPGANAQLVLDTVAAPSNSRSTAWKTCSTCRRNAPTTAPTR